MSKLQELIKQHCPNGVEYKKLGEVAKVISGSSAPQKSSDFSDYGIPFCRTSDVGKVHMSVDFSEISDRITETAAKKMHLMPKGTILIPKSGASTLLNHKVRLSIESYVVSHLAAIISNTDVINDRYLYYVLSRFDMRELVDDKNYPSVKTSEIAERIQIPVPPLEVQEEIVKILDRFSEYAAELQAELQARREQYEYYRDKLLSFNKIGGVLWLTMNEIGTFIRGNGLQKKDFTESGFPCIHYGQIHTHYGTFANETISKVSHETAAKSKLASYGDIIFAITSEDVDGCCKAVAWLGEDDIAVSGHIAIFKHSQNPKYLAYYSQTEMFARQKRKFVHGTKVVEISPDKIKDILVPIPPLAEQERIVGILDKFETLVNDLSEGLPSEIAAVGEQYEYYRNKLLTFPRA